VAEAALACDVTPTHRNAVIAVAGTAMNAGKTTTAASLARVPGAGFRPGYAKVTARAPGRSWLLADAGASVVLDFTDVGHVSTYRCRLDDIERICLALVAHLQEAGVDVILLEIADGLYQRETAHLLRSDAARQWFDGVVFAAADAMARAGIEWLARERHRLLTSRARLPARPCNAPKPRPSPGNG
jgi:hypothetical protein